MARTIKRALKALAVLVLVLLLAAAGYEQVGRWAADRDFPPPGQLVAFEGDASHLHCAGEGSPTVILESGLDVGGSLSWETVRTRITEHTRVCAYDRAGIMWSDARPGPRDANNIVSELHDLLVAASEEPPYVLVGHSLGGPIVRVYTERFPDEVSGLVFVDASHPEQIDRLPQEIRELQPVPSGWLIKTLSRFGVLRLRSTTPGGPLPEQARQAMASHTPTSLPGAVGEMQAIEALFAQARGTGDLGDRPLVVLTAGRMPDPLPPPMTPELAQRMRAVWETLQSELADLSTNSDHRVIEDATHYVHWDDPDAAVSAVADVVTAARTGTPVRREER